MDEGTPRDHSGQPSIVPVSYTHLDVYKRQPLNNVEESPLKPSRRVAAFQKRLESHGITATVRRKLGGEMCIRDSLWTE